MTRKRKTDKQKLIEKLVRDAFIRAALGNIGKRQGGKRANRKSKLYNPGG